METWGFRYITNFVGQKTGLELVIILEDNMNYVCLEKEI